MYSRILVPLDGSRIAEQALGHAERLVAPGGELVLVQVVTPAVTGAVDFASTRSAQAISRATREALEKPRAAARAYLAEAARRIARGDVRVTTRVLEGDPVEALVEAARDVDVVVLSSNGRTAIARFLIGSVAERVVRHAPVPVLVVR